MKFLKIKIDDVDIKFNLQESIKMKRHSYQLKKLFKNLIENAYKYKSHGGRIFIKAIRTTKKIDISIMNEAKHIPSEDLPFIFEHFFRVDKSRSSTVEGFGLNICKEIIDSHNGKIQVTSKKDLGTIFKLSFPLQD